MRNRTFLILLTLITWGTISNNANATTYEIGPGKTYSRILQISTHNLQAGDSIKVFYKSTPYYEKFLLHGIGTQTNPIILIGIADTNGNKPILDGTNALSNTNSSYWNEERQVLLIGQGLLISDYIIVDGFVIREANNFNTFTDNSGNKNTQYAKNACGIRVSSGKNITIRNCDITNNGIGIQSGKIDNMNLLVEYCNVYNNGKCSWNNPYIHNFYLSSGANSVVVVQYSHIGELLSNGQQFRSRSHSIVIRYNWIEGGRNSSLDLMQGDNLDETIAHNAYVYGNVIVKPDSSENSRIIHFGTDNNNYNRVGTCNFYNNTVIIKDTKTWGTRRIFKLSSTSANIIADNNVFYKNDAASYNLLEGFNNLTGSDNWSSNNINGINVLTNSQSGSNPKFINYNNEDYQLDFDSPCLDVVSSYSFPIGYELMNQYVKHTQSIVRPINGNIDLGAFERAGPLSTGDISSFNNSIVVFPNPTNGIIEVGFENIKEILIFDITGQFIKGNKLKSSIDISELPHGLYLLKFKTSIAVHIIRIIKN